MNVAVQIEFKADRKEPLGNLVRRVAAQFQQSGLQPEIVATFGDTPAGLRPTSAVERAIRKYPHLARFERNDAPLPRPGMPSVRRLTNGDPSNPLPSLLRQVQPHRHQQQRRILPHHAFLQRSHSSTRSA